jgi:tetratricopeptide (TPR) repeat protein
LYINGDEGSQSDKFTEGVSIAYFGDDLLLLDRKTRTVIVYQLTEFGQAVNEAISLHNQGRFEEASEIWREVLVLNTNYGIAYNGIGKYYLREKDYATAMEYFNAGHDFYYYSKAYKGYRNEILKANFGYIVGAVVIILGGFTALKVRSTYKKGGSILYED